MVKKYRSLYFLLILPVIHQIVFEYLPIWGIVLSFKDFKFGRGILGSEWNNFEHYKRLFDDYLFYRVLGNTVKISLLNIFTGFIVTIIFALLINEIVNIKIKKAIQTISYLPHFISWVVISGFVYQLLSTEVGLVNAVLSKLDIIPKPIFFMGDKDLFVPILIISLLWQSVGWGSIIYLSAIAGIEQSQYESAEIDGANRFQKMVNITLPGIMPTATILLILAVGKVMKVGFDPVYNLYNAQVMSKADVFSTYTFRIGILGGDYAYSAAIGIFQNVVGFILVITSNKIAKSLKATSVF